MLIDTSSSYFEHCVHLISGAVAGDGWEATAAPAAAAAAAPAAAPAAPPVNVLPTPAADPEWE